MPLDSFQREINYLRISVIDACNLRCTYCMPLEGMRFLPKGELLTPQEIGEVTHAAVDCGFRKFRITGGEPTLRRDLEQIVEQIKAVPGVGELSMTTNGILLPMVAQDLKNAGLDRVNLHIDTLNDARLRQVMRKSDLKSVWAGIEAAEAAGLTPIKLNTVVVKDENECDVVDLARLTLDRDWHIRFIELMPLGDGAEDQYSRVRLIESAAIQKTIESELGTMTPVINANRSDESRNFRLPGAQGVVGFISPVSTPFCDSCNRLRISAAGKFHLCLLKDDQVDAMAALRGGGGREAIRKIIEHAVRLKPVGHELSSGKSTSKLRMHQIGG